jgi:hypothetical protein
MQLTKLIFAALLSAPLTAIAGCSGGQGVDTVGTNRAEVSGDSLASLALANLGGMACQTNSRGGGSFNSSCTGNGGEPEYWCADFVKWVWQNNGVDTGGLSAAAGSFYVYGQNHGTLSNTPSLGAAIVFNYQGGGSADHVAIVTRIFPNGAIETTSGDWNGQNGSEAFFSRTSHVILNAPAFNPAVGSSPGIIGMTISGYVSPAGSTGGGGGTPPPPPPPPSDCSVHSDGKLYCGNTPSAALYGATNLGSSVVNHLRTTSSWFDCWGTGERHAGGNTTWYHTLGDDNGNWGWAPAVELQTSDALDANPSAKGLRQCVGASPPPPPPPPPAGDPSCNVHSDGKLYCANTPGAAMYGADNFGSGVVNHVRTSSSWFDCWGFGERHAGGNNTWYHTLGDDNGNWGWVPAVDLATSSALDANPAAAGLHACN